MKFIQQLDRADKISKSKQIVYENVRFQSGSQFTNLLNELARVGLIDEHWTRTPTDKSILWNDWRHRNGVLIETSVNPMIQGVTPTLTVSGNHSALLQVKSLMERFAEYDGKPEPEDIDLTYQYHDELNDMLWDKHGDSYSLDPSVRKKLLANAEAFFSFLKVEDVEVEDIVLTGSAANYNWTEHSDIDLHLIVDMETIMRKFGPLIKEYFDTKKRLWNDLHNIIIRGFPVEFYVEDSNEEHVSTGVYSLDNDQWIKEPTYEEPSVNDSAVKAKAAEVIGEIQDVLASNKASAVEHLMDKIRKMRQSGLSQNGEFSTENIVFKQLRNDGWLEKMSEFKTKTFDRALSIEEEELSELLS